MSCAARATLTVGSQGRTPALWLGRVGWGTMLQVQLKLATKYGSRVAQDAAKHQVRTCPIHCVPAHRMVSSQAGDQQDRLLLMEHPHTYTAGRRQTLSEPERRLLTQTGAEVFEAKRGGQMTYHGPGQIVGYPIFNTRNHDGVRCFVHRIEEAMIHTCATLNIDADRSPHTGVWVGNDKICAIGLQIKRGISLHGFALNCNTDLRRFNAIVPCGLADRGVTSLSQQCGRQVDIIEGRQRLLEAWQQTFPAWNLEAIDIASEVAQASGNVERITELIEAI